MLHLKRSQLSLEHASFGARLDLRLQPLHLALELSLLEILNSRAQHFRQAQAGGEVSRLELAITIFLLPARQHEWMDIQSTRHVLYLNLRVKRELDCLNLELVAVTDEPSSDPPVPPFEPPLP
jgi:hypothetical protein